MGREREKGPGNREVDQGILGVVEGTIEPVPVELPPLPKDASTSLRRVAAFYELVRGVRLDACKEEPVPFASDWVGGYLDLSGTTVWRILQRLEASGVLVHDGEEPSGKGKPIFLWSPGVLPGAAVAAEGRAEVVGDPAEVVPELKDEKLVGVSEPRERREGLGAAVGRAGHSANRTPPWERIA